MLRQPDIKGSRDSRKTGGAPSDQLRELRGGESFTAKRNVFVEYERQYVLAIKTHNPSAAEAILVAMLTLLWE